MSNPSLPLLLIASLGVACQQSPPTPNGAGDTASAALATNRSTLASRSDAPPGSSAAPRPPGSTADGGASPAKPDLQGLETFAGFSPDETKFAYAVYGENAAAYIFKAFQISDGTLLENKPIQGRATSEVRQLLEQGNYRTLPKASTDYTAEVKGGEILVSQGGKEIARAKVLGGDVPDKPTQAQVWARSPSGKWLVVELVADFGKEFGKARMFALAPLEQGAAK